MSKFSNLQLVFSEVWNKKGAYVWSIIHVTEEIQPFITTEAISLDII